jgi:heat shock protein 5
MSNQQDFEPILGIDLGSANSACAVYMNGVPIPIPNEIGIKTTPSVISFRSSDKKDWVVGQSAFEGLGLEHEYNVSYVKRIIGLNKDDEILQNNLNNKEIFPFGHKFDEKDRVKILIKTPKNINDYGKDLNALSKENIEELEFFPEEISALILKRIKYIAEEYLGRKIQKAVITVPAYFHANQKEATKNAGKLAGLEVINMINEPTSAALAYGINLEQNKNENYLVFDLGAGTFDVTILNISVDSEGSRDFEVIGTSGENSLGGRDFDKPIIDLLNKKIKENLQKNVNNENKKSEKDETDYTEEEKKKLQQYEDEIFPEILSSQEYDYYNDFNLQNRIKMESEMAKIRLSYNKKATIDLNTISAIAGEEITITQDDFNNWNDKLFLNCMDVIDKLLKEKQIKKEKIKNVILIGGASRMPKIQEKIKTYFGLKELMFSVDPEEAVCLGASIQGAISTRQIDYKINDINLFDIVPFNYGIEVRGNRVETIISKFSRIPIIVNKNFKAPKSANISIKIYEGDYQLAKDNTLIGDFKIFIKANELIKVKFEIDVNSILTVKATDENNLTEKERVIANNKCFTKEEFNKLKIQDINYGLSYVTIPKTLKDLKKKHLEANEKNEKEKFNSLMEYIKSYELFIKNINTEKIESNKRLLNNYTFFLKDLINQYSLLLNFRNEIKNLGPNFIKNRKEFLGECFDKIDKIPNIIIYQLIQGLLTNKNEYKNEIYSFCVLFVGEHNVSKIKKYIDDDKIFKAKNLCHENFRKFNMFNTKKNLENTNYLNKYKKVFEETRKYSIGVKVINFIDLGFKLYEKGVKQDKIINIRYFMDSVFFLGCAKKLLEDDKYTFEAKDEQWIMILRGYSMLNYINYNNNKITKNEYEKKRKAYEEKINKYSKNLDITIEALFENCQKSKNFKPFLEKIVQTLPSDKMKPLKDSLNNFENQKEDVLKKFRKILNPLKWPNKTDEEKKTLSKVNIYSAYINSIFQYINE